MKMQRWSIGDDTTPRGYDDDGIWCLSDDVAKLEAENTQLHAECDRLTAMVGPQKILSAEEITADGFYWYRLRETDPWLICEYVYNCRTFYTEGEDMFTDCPQFGQFIGPLTAPEV